LVFDRFCTDDASQGRLRVDTGPSKEREARIRAYSITASAWARIDWGG